MIESISNFVTNHLQKADQYVNENPTHSYYLQGLLLSIVIYFLYLELNPKIGGIFFRPDSTGTSRFRFKGIIPMLKFPFQSFEFWKPKNWDLNFIIFTQAGAGIYTLLKYYLNHIVTKK